jgi:transcriptional regulator with XRE-family HTH domain
MKDRLTQFGLKCREFRARYNLTMGDQAKGLDVSVPYISAIERGNRECT